MRISADPKDYGYNPQQGQFLSVLLNGTLVQYVVTADTEAGYVLRYKMDAEGQPVTADNGELATEEVFGEVRMLLALEGAEMLKMPKPLNFERTAGWLNACGKVPENLHHLSVQVGVHIEEMLEFMEQLSPGEGEDVATAIAVLHELARQYKSGKLNASFKNEEKALDALCDMEVTANGVAYLAAWNKPEADSRVLAANDAKLVDGKPVILEGGKIGKPEGWQAADLSDCV